MDRAKEKEIAFYNKVEEAYLSFCQQTHLLNKLNVEKLKDIVPYLHLLRGEEEGRSFLKAQPGQSQAKVEDGAGPVRLDQVL